MKLFEPAWKGKNEERAIAWIRACKNQQKLKTAAMEAPGLYRRIEAIQKLTDAEDSIAAAFQQMPRRMTACSEDREAWEKCRKSVLDRVSDPAKLLTLACRETGDTSSHLAGRLMECGLSREELVLDRRLHYRLRLAPIWSLHFAAEKDPAAEAELCRLAGKLFQNEPRSIVCTTAVRFIRSPEVHKAYCERYEDMGEAQKWYGKYHDGGYRDIHEWELVESGCKEIGDTRFESASYRCVYCGRMRREEESYRF